MKTKSFDEYLKKRLDKKTISAIARHAKNEHKILKNMQSAIANAVESYMEENNLGFNELVRRLHSSPAHIVKIQRGEANLTLSSMAHLFALLGKEPQELFKSKK